VHNGSAGQEGGNPTPDNRYSVSGTWAPEDQSTINALNDPYTWDMHVRVVDSTGNAEANAYDEFGIYMFTDLGTWSIPGDLSAAGAPGTNNVSLGMMGSPTFDLTYSSNCEYRIRVYMDDDLRSVSTSDIIPATDISVQGGTLGTQTYFGGFGVGNAIYLVGDTSPTYIQPESTGTTTTTTQANAGAGAPLQWVVDIPVVAEASYSASAVYEILHT